MARILNILLLLVTLTIMQYPSSTTESALILRRVKKYLLCFIGGMKRENRKDPGLGLLFVKKSWICIVVLLLPNVNLSVQHSNAIFRLRNCDLSLTLLLIFLPAGLSYLAF